MLFSANWVDFPDLAGLADWADGAADSPIEPKYSGGTVWGEDWSARNDGDAAGDTDAPG